MNKKESTSNQYLFLLKKYLLALFALFATQIVFRLCNTRLFHLEGAEWISILWGNIRYGCATITAFLIPFLIICLLPFKWRGKKSFRIVSELLYNIPIVIILVTNLIDCAYYQFTYRRMSYEILGYLSVGGDMGNLVPHFLIDYWYVTLSGLAIIAAFLYFSLRIHYKYRRETSSASDWVGCVLSLVVCFVLLRGGFHKEFIQMDEAPKYCQMKNSALVINSPYNILRTLGKDDLEEKEYIDAQEARKLYTPTFVGAASKEPTPIGNPYWCVSAGSPQKIGGLLLNNGSIAGQLLNLLYDDNKFAIVHKNIVVIVLESFSQEYMGCYNNSIMDSYTPFLDSLAERSIVFDGRSNGKKSIEAIPAIFASIPTWMEMPFIMSDYYKDSIVGLPKILRDNGYHTAFFHGSYNGSMDFDKFCDKAGFSEYYGRTEYGNDSDWDHAWGIYDEPFLQFMAKKIGEFDEPFFAGIFTISSHHPYSIPEQHQGQFKKGKHPLLECVMYSDYALSQFFHACEKQPWYENTVFLITADHPGQGLHKEYNDYNGWYNIPMIFFDPSMAASGINRQNEYRNELFQQIDIMPTLLDYIGVKGQYICFGQSHLQGNKNYWQILFGNGYYQILRNGQISAIEGDAKFGADEDIRFMQSVLQQYNHRLINDELTINTTQKQKSKKTTK